MGTLEHTYTAPGAVTIIVDVTDEDGTFPAAGTLDLSVVDDGPAPVPTCDIADATIVGTNGNDVLVGTDGDDVIWAGPGKDIVFGMGGDDIICGGDDPDLLFGGAGQRHHSR